MMKRLQKQRMHLYDYVALYGSYDEATTPSEVNVDDDILKASKKLKDYGFNVDYTFENIKYEVDDDNKTDQSRFINLDAATGIITVNPEFGGTTGAVAKGKTPIIKVKATVNGKELAVAFIKIKIVESAAGDPANPEEILYELNNGQGISYTALNATGTSYGLTWAAANDIYTSVNLDKATFATRYQAASFVYEDGDNEKKAVAGVTPVVNNLGTGDTDPIEVGLKITNEAAVGTKTVVLEFTPKDNVADIYPTVYVKFKYTIDEFAPVAQFVPSRDYSSLVDASNNTAEVKGKLVNDQWKFEVALSDLFTIKSADAKN